MKKIADFSRMKKLPFIIMIGILSFSAFFCKRQGNSDANTENQSSVRVFDLNLNKYIEREFKLSETADSIEYVFLETTKSNFIGEIKVIRVSSKYIILTDRITKKVHAFDRRGKYLFEMAKIGKGPGEFIQIGDLIIDELNQCVYLEVGYGEILKYSLDNNYIETLNFEVDPRFIATYDSGYVAVVKCPVTIRYSGFTFSFLGFDGKIREQKAQHDMSGFTGQEPMLSSSYYIVNDTICLWEACMDTVYGFAKNGLVVPRWTFNYGNDQISKKDMKSVQGFDKAIHLGFIMTSFIETPHHIFSRSINKGNLVYLIFDKKENKSIIFNSADNSRDGIIVNDLDGILDFWPKFTPASNTTLMAIDPIKFQKAVNQAKIIPSNQRTIDELSQKVNNIGQFDNPVLCIVKHK